MLISALLLTLTSATPSWKATYVVVRGDKPTIVAVHFGHGIVRVDRPSAGTSSVYDLSGKQGELQLTHDTPVVPVERRATARYAELPEWRSKRDLVESVRLRDKSAQSTRKIQAETARFSQQVPKPTGQSKKVDPFDCAMYSWNPADTSPQQACFLEKHAIGLDAFISGTRGLVEVALARNAAFDELRTGYGVLVAHGRAGLLVEHETEEQTMRLLSLVATASSAADLGLPKSYKLN